MFEIEIDRSFSAAHQLRGYNGDCCKLHGHNYKITVTVRSSELDEIGIALDFKKLKAELDALLAEYDHSNLSELADFQAVNPTSENLARTIYRKISEKMNSGTIRVHRVRVGESDHSAVTYFED
ncbi:6-carboxytetrahydropterin synthase QueD [Victivallis vadensis]|uniref:6-carboxy-5,6,7,8-tetrahydropterin synthase n=3 Tax=Victivallis TaxID=172900 RepID=A0A2U1B4J4_9BACT|nr:6-carboxytetrahydropterin synthase QueD [Victivallis vadensis]PVY43593.1 6-pyruvoyltetrahydropterin/6-carboxytetrahydropterin synthase [Victivallis vadensis]HJH04244.1 6-carboxytetrahydropterin synthase QueD [Victivallis vadensis]